MTKSRLLYFLLLLTSVLCQIFFDTYPAHLLFLISVSLPPLSLLLSLPGPRGGGEVAAVLVTPFSVSACAPLPLSSAAKPAHRRRAAHRL